MNERDWQDNERWLRYFIARQQRREAIASVALDNDSDLHTCYEGHCTPTGGGTDTP